MARKVRYLAVAALCCAAVAAVYVAVHWSRGSDVGRGVELVTGRENRIELAPGDYTLWWHTRAHPEHAPDFPDFVFRFVDGSQVGVSPPSPYLVSSGRESGLLIFSVGELSVPQRQRVTIVIDVANPAVPPGELLLIAQ